MTRFNRGDAWFFYRYGHGMDDPDDHDEAGEREEEETMQDEDE
jgi:hypothetical protein